MKSRACTALLVVAIAVAAMIASFGALAGCDHGDSEAPADVPPQWSTFRNSPGHKAHVGKKDIVCKDCHDYAKEGFKSPGAAPCGKCHENQEKHPHGKIEHADAGAMSAENCLTCHAFAPNKPKPTCIGCHEKVEGHSPAIKTHSTTECTECHKPHGDPSVAPKECSSCHEQRADAHADHLASKGCNDCHAPHTEAKAAATMCSTCHAHPSGPKPAGHQSCESCHKPHEFTANGATCTGCHGHKPTIGASHVTEHADCTSCHTPHDPAPAKAVKSCVSASCHADIALKHGGRAPAEGACVGCHAPHKGNVDARVSVAACSTCHASVGATDKAAHAGGVACTSCHVRHDFTPKQKPALCATCHVPEATLASHNKGHADCTQCHGQVAHKPEAAPACGTCHKTELATAPVGHQPCNNCHVSHSGERKPEAACGSCHVMESKSPHAKVTGSCATCHRPHGPSGIASPPPCTSCHQKGSLPALHAMPAHEKCANCHTSHLPPKADRDTCTGTCHADKKDHQPTATSCNGCHRFRK